MEGNGNHEHRNAPHREDQSREHGDAGVDDPGSSVDGKPELVWVDSEDLEDSMEAAAADAGTAVDDLVGSRNAPSPGRRSPSSRLGSRGGQQQVFRAWLDGAGGSPKGRYFPVEVVEHAEARRMRRSRPASAFARLTRDGKLQTASGTRVNWSDGMRSGGTGRPGTAPRTRPRPKSAVATRREMEARERKEAVAARLRPASASARAARVSRQQPWVPLSSQRAASAQRQGQRAAAAAEGTLGMGRRGDRTRGLGPSDLTLRYPKGQPGVQRVRGHVGQGDGAAFETRGRANPDMYTRSATLIEQRVVSADDFGVWLFRGEPTPAPLRLKPHVMPAGAFAVTSKSAAALGMRNLTTRGHAGPRGRHAAATAVQKQRSVASDALHAPESFSVYKRKLSRDGKLKYGGVPVRKYSSMNTVPSRAPQPRQHTRHDGRLGGGLMRSQSAALMRKRMKRGVAI